MNASTPSYTRRIGPDDWTYIGMGIPNVCQHVYEGDGDLTVEALAAALEKVGDACPGTRLRRKKRAWVDSGVAPEVRVVNLEPGQDLLAHPALQTTLNDGGATCEVLFVPGEAAGGAVGEDADGPGRRDRPLRLVFRGFHGITDARGMLVWAADVFQALRGEEPQGATSTLNTGEFLQHLMPQGLPPIQRGVGKPEWTTPMAPAPRGQRYGHIWRRRTVDGIHAAVTAKVIAAVAAMTPDEPMSRFFVPVDLRRHQPDLRSTGWLSLSVNLNVEPGTGWEQVHRELLTALAERREFTLRSAPWLLRMPLPVIRFFSDGMEDTARRKQRYMGTAFVASMGSVDLAEYSAQSFRASTVYILGSSGPSAPPGIDVVESGGRTEIVIAWRDVPGAAERMDAVLDTIAEALSPRADREQAANRTDREPASSRSLLRMFRDQVELTPDAIALTGPQGDVSYRQLSLRADAVTSALRARGVGRGDVVGLLAERTPGAIAGIWGILRAGAAYLPLDVQHPDARLADLLGDSGARYCLVEASQQTREHTPAGCEPLGLDDLAAATAAPAREPDADPRPDDLAYVLYTSGSTGRPKGVQVEHAALLNYLHWGAEEFGVDASTRLPLLTSLSFDVSGTSIFLPLITGGTVVLVQDQPTHLTLRRMLEDSGATMLNLTPSHLELIGRLDIAPRGFRSIVVVGEQLRVEVAARAQEMFGPDCRIINEYGPTEATIGCTAHTFDPVGDADRAAVPIGVPAHNTQVHLLDPNRRFVPNGEVGEMYLAGVQLARGYLGRPDLDAERFPTLADGTRVYRTGDLARRLPDGTLEFLGRIDDQVKVRGHRVEPAEVAGALEEHPRVDRAVVVARSRADGSGKALYGYVLVNAEVSAEELQAHAARRLPAYMVPAATLVVEEIPYSVAGKVDARALPDPFADRTHTGSAASAGSAGSVALAASAASAADPDRDAIESQVALIWSDVLGVDEARIDARTDFLQLGGDSLALLTMLAGVCRDVLPPQTEAEFMSQLGRFIAEPTLDTVSAIAREVSRVPVGQLQQV
ncbi:non-ribosomal peptide synthetase [Streptomyces sp. FH025]|uniref:non-ribosomal peptide synthetase n=1 Tax=Streptomyces sp. FH025 TaxID=2815937 RepID=UPI001A9FEF64|nr:non-ribosomal peptide synthetase [Streptomyces sp. FH025]MBO1417746.1 non-ribosomal peptide synthetase [Streptomyces sp. FH025]